ncbi:ribonuclease T2 family protein [Rivihabitans pingtungensis]|jgi:ribonuclease T2|uniref:ribonuclease T2 family protein n=1 Tax=Rivihabitans pingtungensis TaxID=1054498 RepID=UPI0023567F28|nr:hypothetical protein [Rivihabitans pingtungensis]MCK6435817.1 hypothetical protein [Rivihabitans pingtungensis]
MILSRPSLALTLALVLGGLTAQAHAAGYAGAFSAEQACTATVNKPKAGKPDNNPDQFTVQSGVVYPIIDADAPNAPTWYRIQAQGAQPAERWVSAHCGRGALTSKPASTSSTSSASSGKACNLAGQGDSYVFAVSWQAAFCETHQSKPECQQPTPWASQNFTLHGLWPNLGRCGTNYGYCSSQPQQKNFCDYPEPAISASTMRQLGEVMPSAAAGSCLQRHEWFKHGTCQTEWDADGYFEVAIDLVKQFNASGVGPFIAANRGLSIPTQDLFAVIDQGLGANAHKRMKFFCTNGQLVDIYMNLPDSIPRQQPKLGPLLQAAKEGFSSSCGESFRVDVM